MDVSRLYADRIADTDLKTDPAQEAVLPAFQRIADGIETPPKRRGFFSRKSPEPVRGLYLWGGVGRGKSMLMDLFHEGVEPAGGGKRRVHFHAFMQDVHRRIGKARERGVDDAVAPVAEALGEDIRLLCLDEMQIGDITDAMIVGRLFEGLLERGVTIVTTSNRPPDDLYKDGLNRNLFEPFIDLLNERLEVAELDSPRDWRRESIAGEETYLTPLDAGSESAMDRIWRRLTGGRDPEPLSIEVTGRTVAIPDHAAGVGRAPFRDLCGRALGAADYLALADRVRVLMIDGVPRLGRDNHNEAKRFVTLVDALYEAKTRLVMSAAAPPEDLYAEGTGSFEFARTASRLREMQSDDWGGGPT